MPQFNRREFLLSSVAVSAAAALTPHTLAMTSEGALQPDTSVLQEARTAPIVQPQFTGSLDFITWRQEGSNLVGGGGYSRHSLR